jgi:hypothetical protein
VQPVGYVALKRLYDLPGIPHHRVSYIVQSARRTVDNQEYYPTVYQPEDSLAGHLEFALKYEGVNLAILSALFRVADGAELISYIQSRPTGIHTRRVWFLYEFLTGSRLSIPDLQSTCGYVDALDPKEYVTQPGERLLRYRVRNNLLGTRDFCPVVRRSAVLQQFSWEALRDIAEVVVHAYDPETVSRAINYLYTKETRSSFAIEHETPTASKMERFGHALQSVQSYPVLDKQALLGLQSIVLDEKAAATDYRTEQNYVGETLGCREIVHFISPKPEDVPSMMTGLLEFCCGSAGIDPIIAAAVASFGFVFIHPFDDGNGRIHRYMIHHFLANRGVTPKGTIFPVSATMLNNMHEYNASLESFSSAIMPLIEYRMNEDFSLDVLNETADLYRYFDATRMCEYLYDCVRKTIDNELKEELETLSAFAQARVALDATFDLPEKQKNLLLKLCWQGKGTLSATKRMTHFKEYSDEEMAAMVAVISPFFRPR